MAFNHFLTEYKVGEISQALLGRQKSNTNENKELNTLFRSLGRVQPEFVCFTPKVSDSTSNGCSAWFHFLTKNSIAQLCMTQEENATLHGLRFVCRSGKDERKVPAPAHCLSFSLVVTFVAISF